MSALYNLLKKRGYVDKGWDVEGGYGEDSLLICPHGHMIEKDGSCHEGCTSPLLDMGMI